MAKRREIRNSTAEFLIFQIEGKSQGVEVFYKDKTVWCTQKAMGMLFDCTSDNISVHLQNIYDTDELKKEATTEKISVVRREGNRDVNRTLQFYNLDAIISVGYRVNSIRATQFRQWATSVLREFAIRGYVLDRKRMENGTFLDEDYFEHLLAEIREIRLSERRFYQKLTDIYATAIDYNRDAPTTRQFFQMMQNKMENVRNILKVDTVVGDPIYTPDGIMLVPISRISVGFGGGGVEFNSKKAGERPYGGGNATGVKIEPIGFLIIKDGVVRMVNVTPPASNTVDRVIDLVPQVMDRIDAFIDKHNEGKNENK